MQSIWVENITKPTFAALNKGLKTDVLIVGGGIAGLLCAKKLDDEGVDYVLVEANDICGGITKNTTAKITFQHGLIYQELIDKFGHEIASKYLESQYLALNEYRELSKGVDCDFEEVDSYVYSTMYKSRIENEIRALKSLHCSCQYVDELPLPIKAVGAVRVENQAQFHPLKFLYHIAKDLNVYEQTKVIELTKDGAITDKGKIKADKIVVATHFPFIDKYGGYFLKMYQHRSYVIAYENAPKVNGIYVDEAEQGLSFRNYKDWLLVGGGSHRTGKQGGSYAEIRAFANVNYASAREICSFATQDCMTLDGIPYIGKYSPKTPNIFVTTGFNKWGMSSAMVGANLIKDMVIGNKNDYEEVFDPNRSIMHPQLFVNLGETLKGLLTPTVPRCPHLGCALKYNKQEHSWDCACHGSRFTDSGKLIDNPATKDVEK
ncbi:MAG: FAD-dependent oxidoreductase [Clostridia bacterium]|nr:FAD-dependent oxidoreductase [Clostridia bacterium]